MESQSTKETLETINRLMRFFEGEKTKKKADLTPEQGALLLEIFRSHSVAESGMFLSIPEMCKIYGMLHSDKKISAQQKLRECCFAGTTTLHQLIGPSFMPSKRAFTALPGTLETFIEGLTTAQANHLLHSLIDPLSGELIEQDPGQVFLNAVHAEDSLLFAFLCAAGPTCAAVEQGLQKKDKEGKTALMHASLKGDLYIVQELLQTADCLGIKFQLLIENDDKGTSALMHGVSEGHVAIAQALLDAVSSGDKRTLLRHRNLNAWTPFMYATLNGNLATLQLLLANELPEHRVSFFMETNAWGQIPLMLATNLEILNFLLNQGVVEGANTRNGFLTATDTDGMTALHYAVISTHAGISELVDPLLEEGANPADSDHTGVNVLMRAARLGNGEIVERLLNSAPPQAQVALLHARDLDGQTAFMHAALGEGNAEVMRILFEAESAEARVGLLNQQDNDDQTPLMQANSTEKVLFLLNAADGMDRDGDLHLRKNLLEARDQNGLTALWQAVRRRYEEEADAEADAVVNEEQRDENFNIIQTLLQNGANPVDPNNEGITLLMYANEKQDVEMIQALSNLA